MSEAQSRNDSGDAQDCPTESEFSKLLTGDLSPVDERKFEEHISGCEACQSRLERQLDSVHTIPPDAQLGFQPPSSGELERVMQALKGDQTRPQSKRASTTEVVGRLLTESPNRDALGRLGDYDVLEVLGQGGMGIVFRAQDLTLDRIVAVKALLPAFAADSSARDRFVREAKAAASIQHPNVVTMFAVGESLQTPLLAMEYVEGETLADRIERGSLESEELLRVSLDLASALEAAHGRNLIHRDIKPSNVLVDSSTGRAKISDFGLVKAVDDSSQLTVSGAVMGTPEFMSPEQAGALVPLDERSDLFSLGVLLYAAATGSSPFRGASMVATLRRVCDHHPQPLASVAPNLPGWYCQLVDRLLQKSPSDRIQSAQELSEALNRRSLSESAEVKQTMGRRAAIAGAMATAALGMGYLLTRPGKEEATDELPEGFYTAGNRRHDDLVAAIESAEDGDTIVVRSNDEHAFESVRLETKRLTIQAGKGYMPVFVGGDDHGQPAFHTDSDLKVEGCVFKWSVSDSDGIGLERAVIVGDGGSLTIRNCEFEIAGRFSAVASRGEASIENCVFRAPEGAAVTLFTSDAGRLNVDNTRFDGRVALVLFAEQAERPTTAKLTGCLFQTASAMEIRQWPTEGHCLDIDASSCTFAVSSHVLGDENLFGFADRGDVMKRLAQHFSWVTDRANRYVGINHFVLLKRRRGRFSFSIDAVNDWNDLWQIDNEAMLMPRDEAVLAVEDPQCLGPGARFDTWRSQSTARP